MLTHAPLFDLIFSRRYKLQRTNEKIVHEIDGILATKMYIDSNIRVECKRENC